MKKEKVNYSEIEPTVRGIMEEHGLYSVTQATKEACVIHGIEYAENIGRNMRSRINGKGTATIEQTQEFINAQNKVHSPDKKRFIVTWAQNDTAVHEAFLNNIKSYANHIDAEILVILGRYKNPSLYIKPEKSTWDSSILPYSCASRIKLHEYLQVLGDIKTQPTAINPLSGMNALTGMESTIIGHPKASHLSLPVLEGYHHKLMYSTGAVTVENYSDSSAGKKGEFHHSLGFVIVEIDGDNFHIRNVSATKSGSFCDLNIEVKNGTVHEGFNVVDTIVLGDIHSAQIDYSALETSIGMLEFFDPKHVILHDLFDGLSISHHDEKNPFRLLEKEEKGITLEWEVQHTKDILRLLLPWNPVIVASNHNSHLDRFLTDTDWRKGRNKALYLKYSMAIAEGKCPKGVVAHIMEEEFGDKVITLGYNDSFRRCGTELGIHGDKGANGSRGSANQYKYFNTKIIAGHSHTPSSTLGFTCVGTLCLLRQDYNQGASSWMHTNALLHTNGKRQSIHMIGKSKKWTTLF